MCPIFFINIFIQLLSKAKISGEEKIVVQHHRSAILYNSMHKYTAKLSLLLLIILEASIYDEGVLSEGVLSGGGFVLPS